MIELDGTMHEGGGQIVRSALTLSMISGKPFRISKIRGRRKVPGLLRQHLVAVQAATRVSQARVTGDALGSTELTFEPGPVTAAALSLAIGSAGSTTLVLQTIVPALLRASGPSTITVEGGTHNPLAPTFEFLEHAWAPVLRRLGASIELRLERHGFYPKGGGRIVVGVTPADLRPLDLDRRGALTGLEVRTILSDSLPSHILEREISQAVLRLPRRSPALVRQHVPSDGMGNAMALIATYEGVTHVSTSLGEKGVPAEEVADELIDDFEQFHERDVPVGEHLADMLPVVFALAGGGSFVTGDLSLHATTQLDLVPRFLDVELRTSSVGEGRLRVDVGALAGLAAMPFG